ncbi:MAG: IPT/TIG domain-containing protein [Anaerolineales bacterium]|nr:IPT/TIG domain-containing protein [Anaerolineales bacterium]
MPKKQVLTLFIGLTVLLAALLSSPGSQIQRASAQTNDVLHLRVESARTESPVAAGDEITQYKYLINVDNTGDPTQARNAGCSADDPNYPDSCDWPSIREVPGAAPIYTQGNQDDFNGVNLSGITLPPGKYLVSVIANGFKIDGAHFTVPLPDVDANGANVVVGMQPDPLPTATMRIKVFEDISPVNGQFDAPAESGLEGFHATINDTAGEITVDVFGNPLCTTYDADMNPTGIETYGCIYSDANGDIVIPNLGPLRYDVVVVRPDGTDWIETTTLEGSPSWDTWLQEGGTGLDNEFVVAGEPFPWTIFGFVHPMDQLNNTAVTGGVSGTIVGASVYLPQQNALPYYGDIWNGFNGAKVTGPIEDAWVALSDLQNGDTAVYVAKANPDGTFLIENVPDGNYQFTWWDEKIHYIMDWIQVTVSNGQIYDMGTPFLTGWFTKVDGYVFNDLNENGIKDPGEPGISNYLVVLRDRDNSEIDRMSIAVTTDENGYYVFEKAYPMGSWMILEAYNDRFYTTGITYQVENQPTPTTVVGQGVDVGVLPILGQSGRLDWGVRPYDATGRNGGLRNGGIVGTVFYDITRNELDPQYQAVEPWAPGIPNVEVQLYATVYCGTNPGTACDPTGMFEIASDGSLAKGDLLNTALTETWEQPTDCTARDANGNPLLNPQDQQVLPVDPTGKRCVEGPLMGTQFQTGFATLDGNYGFTEGCFGGDIDASDPANPICPSGWETLWSDDYLVEVVSPIDALGREIYQVVREEDVNIFDGDQYVPQVPPPACAGPMHVVDVAGIGTDGPDAVDNANFADGGGSPYEGMTRPLCNVKLVTLNNGKSIAPTFTYFTEVPIPGKWKGYIIDDLTISTNPQELNFGEKAGIPNSPIGIYDYNNRLLTTIQSDPNGVFEVLLPGTNTINCPTPSGVCANVYYMLGNDPGQPGHLNPNYSPQYRTIGASFEIYSGLLIPSDLAPTQIVPGVLAAGSLFGVPPQCTLNDALNPTTPEIFAVSKPYHNIADGNGTITIDGQGFGSAGQVTLDDNIVLPAVSWSDTSVTVSVSDTLPPGPHQLKVMNGIGRSTVNGLTFRVLAPDTSTFPATAVLDNFNRPNSNNLGGNWSSSSTGYRINNNNLQVRGGALTVQWTNQSFGPDQEVYFTFVDVSGQASEQNLLLKFSGNAVIQAIYHQGAADVEVQTYDPFNGWQSHGSFPATFANGDQFGARTLQDGTVNLYKNGALLGSTNVTTGPNGWPTSLAQGGGQIGVWFLGTTNFGPGDARIDNFGGGNVSVAAGYDPALFEVGPGRPYATIQSAIDAAASASGSVAPLVVVYPDTPVQWNPTGSYFENVAIYSPVSLQGVGPGGVYPDGTPVLGSVIDGRGVAGDTDYATNWRTFVQGLTWDGNQAIYEGAVVYVLAEDGEMTAAKSVTIDGLSIQGGDQQGFPNNLQPADPTVKEFAAVQGGGVFANAFARYMHITNNILQSNGGAYASAIRLGTPHLAGAFNDNQNDNVVIAHNRILANGGTNLAGAIGIFSGADNYEVANNDVCGNFSAEYGGGISHYGLSPDGSIHDNRIYFNRSYDEGGGIMIAGELPADPSVLSPGAGPVSIYNNLIQNNLSNDDGGGLRFLMAGNFTYDVYNNIIVNNISTHEGGGVALNDTPAVRFYNNTVMKNITTATAVTSNGFPAPAGLSTAANSDLLQATLPGGSPLFSNPLLFNNIFWDNRAGTFTGATVAGIGLAGDPNAINNWDLGVADGTGLLSPTNSIMQVGTGTVADGSNLLGVDPLVVTTYDTSVRVAPWRGNPRFVDVLMVTAEATPNLLGDYHLASGSPAENAGAAGKGATSAPAVDIDLDARPSDGGTEIGADEIPGAGGPVITFPQTAVLDTFNRVNTTSLGANWSTPSTGFRIDSNTLQARSGVEFVDGVRWTGSTFGANQEAFFTFAQVATTAAEQNLVLKYSGGGSALIQVIYHQATNDVQIQTLDPSNGWQVRATFPGITFSNGDQFGAQALNDGTVNVYKNGALAGTTNVTSGSNPWPTGLAQGGGQIGVWFLGTTNFNSARVDDFGGGNLP